jgi:hypothetical protein
MTNPPTLTPPVWVSSITIWLSLYGGPDRVMSSSEQNTDRAFEAAVSTMKGVVEGLKAEGITGSTTLALAEAWLAEDKSRNRWAGMAVRAAQLFPELLKLVGAAPAVEVAPPEPGAGIVMIEAEAPAVAVAPGAPIPGAKYFFQSFQDSGTPELAQFRLDGAQLTQIHRVVTMAANATPESLEELRTWADAAYQTMTGVRSQRLPRLAARPEADLAGEVIADVLSHAGNWKQGMEFMQRAAVGQDEGYWQHELNVVDRLVDQSQAALKDSDTGWVAASSTYDEGRALGREEGLREAAEAIGERLGGAAR